MLFERCHENLTRLHIGTEPNRAYYIPFDNAKSAFDGVREKSTQFSLLSGCNWKFKFYNSFDEIPESLFYFDTNISNWDEIPVPSCFEMNGYGKPQYLNTRFAIPVDYPNVPVMNPTGVYSRDITVDSIDGKERYIVFEGVDSCFYLYINGEFVGYSQVSHMTSEFNISEYLKVGENRITVVVLKWCDGTYLEVQDKWRLSGIFRDVYMLTRPKNHIKDIEVIPYLSDDLRNASFTVKVSGNDISDTYITLFDTEGEKISTLVPNQDGKVCFDVRKPLFWSAETPDLYTILVESKNEFIPIKSGLRSVKVENGVIKFNGRAIKFKGVNRHDFNPKNGYVCSLENMQNDILKCKRHNINTIRTSHYPNDPRFLELCDKYGIYVMDETDLECHQCRNMPEEYNISNMPEWQDAYIDRLERMVERDKNHPSVFAWSMGNESAYGENIKNMLKWVKKRDSSRISHYEGAYYRNENGSYYSDDQLPERKKWMQVDDPDIYSMMYPHLNTMKDFIRDKNGPLFLCEYCHAMGNGPGELKDYWDLIYSDDRFPGGCVWEWFNHGIYDGESENNKPRYMYGGDFFEKYHDENFCLDGLIQPDGTPTPGLIDYKYAIQPVKIELLDAETLKFKITNRYDFLYLSRLDGFYEISVNGIIKEKGKLDIMAVAPRSSMDFYIAPKCEVEGLCYIRFYFCQATGNNAIEIGEELASEQFLLCDQIEEVKASSTLPPTISADNLNITISGTGFSYTFSKLYGEFTSLKIKGVELLKAPLSLNAYRAPIDNERQLLGELADMGVDDLHFRPYFIKYTPIDDHIKISLDYSLSAPTKIPVAKGHIDYFVYGGGRIETEISAKLNPEINYLQRFGMRAVLPKEFDNLTYFGMGPWESYCDMKNASYMGVFESKPQKEFFDFIKPQANGNHTNSLWCAVTNENGTGLFVQNLSGFDFSAIPYRDETLANAKHNFELQEETFETVLCFDYKQTGVGSYSCGPKIQDKYVLSEKEFSAKFTIQMLYNVNDIPKDAFIKVK